MTAYRTIGSARAETSERRTRRILAGALALAAALLPPGAWGMDSPPQRTADRAGNLLPLPPVPYLESIQWMNWELGQPLFKIDTLLAPGIGPADNFRLPSGYERTFPRTS